jgi:hypothetical protein
LEIFDINKNTNQVVKKAYISATFPPAYESDTDSDSCNDGSTNCDKNIRDNEEIFPPAYSTDGSNPSSDDAQVQSVLSSTESFNVSDSGSITLHDKNIACYSSDDLSTTSITVNNNLPLTNHMNEKL